MESINFHVQSVWVFTIVAYLWLAIVNAHADILLKFNLVLTVKFCKKKYKIIRDLHKGGPARGGPMSPVWILKRLV